VPEPHVCSYAPNGFLEPSGLCLNPGHSNVRPWAAAAAERKALRDRVEAGDPAAVAAAAWAGEFRADGYRNSGFYADQLALAWLAGHDAGAAKACRCPDECDMEHE